MSLLTKKAGATLWLLAHRGGCFNFDDDDTVVIWWECALGCFSFFSCNRFVPVFVALFNLKLVNDWLWSKSNRCAELGQ